MYASAPIIVRPTAMPTATPASSAADSDQMTDDDVHESPGCCRHSLTSNAATQPATTDTHGHIATVTHSLSATWAPAAYLSSHRRTSTAPW